MTNIDIVRISNRMLFVLKVSLLILPLIVILPWLIPHTALGNFMFGFSSIKNSIPDLPKFLRQISKGNIIFGIMASLTSLAPLIMGILLLIKLFKNYAMGQIFILQNVKYYRLLGYICLLSALIFQPLGDVLVSLCVSINNPAGQRYIAFGFSNTNLTALICGIMLIIISRVMQIGNNINEEQKYTI